MYLDLERNRARVLDDGWGFVMWKRDGDGDGEWDEGRD